MNANINLSADFSRTPADIDTELAELGNEAALLELKLARINKRQAHLSEVFQARGGWTRAFLVNNTNGHVHSTMGCSSCFSTTQFQWRTELSGSDQAEIIAAAGELACTVCYPDAPVAVTSKPGTIRTDAMIAREERAAKAAEAAQVKNAKAIFTPEGEPLKGRWGVVKTEVSAQNEAVSAMVDIIGCEISGNALHMLPEYVDIATRFVQALAAKRGQGYEEALMELAVKAARKEQAQAREYNRGSLSNQYGKAAIHNDGLNLLRKHI